MVKRLFPPAFLALFVLFSALPALSLDFGDSAPKITPDVWVTGAPADPTKVDDKTIYLVEVWSTTCPPCVQSIPIMNKLQEKYADQGFKVVSFTSDEVDQVKDFLKEVPIEYSSFIDKEGATYINYMAADNRNTIPHAFLFDRSGALVWIGNPLDNLETRIKQVIDGTLNREKALAIRTAREKLQESFEGQNVGGMLDSLSQLESLEPANGRYYQLHYQILSELGAGDETDVKNLLTAWYKGSKDQADSLMVLSLVAMEQGHPGLRNPELGLAAAKRAFALAPLNDRDEAGMNLAEVYKSIGRLDLSIGVIKELAENASGDDAKALSAIESYYTRLLELGKKPDAEYNP